MGPNRFASISPRFLVVFEVLITLFYRGASRVHSITNMAAFIAYFSEFYLLWVAQEPVPSVLNTRQFGVFWESRLHRIYRWPSFDPAGFSLLRNKLLFAFALVTLTSFFLPPLPLLVCRVLLYSRGSSIPFDLGA